jgi:PQQ-dependent dehydrogenase (methanol/ethanol family)
MKTKTLGAYSIRLGIGLLVFVVLALWLIPSHPLADTRENVDWRHYGNDLANTRFQDVDQINRSNARNLRVAWVFHTGVLDEMAELQASPIVVDGRLFVTDGHDDLFALNAVTGRQIWAYKPLEIPGEMPPLQDISVCCGRNNKGVAFGDGKVFYGRLDNVVVALDAETGRVIWKTTPPLADFRAHYAINNAPQFVRLEGDRQDDDAEALVIISISGGEFEVRGQVFALGADTGRVVWHFFTTDPGSYHGDSFLRGGAAVWNPPAVDPELGMVYVITGNAAPDILGEDRAGDNLFANSIIALDLRTGRAVWHFQAVHHDIWDYDSAQPVVLFPLRQGGRDLKALGHCSKTGQYFILDRHNGQPIFPVTEQLVPPGPDFQHVAPTQPFSAVEPLTPLTFVRPNDTGFPARPQFTPPGIIGENFIFVMVPGDDGGCEWNPAAFSPRTKFIYYGTRYEPTTFQTHSGNNMLVNGLHLGSTFVNRVPGSHPFGIFGATDTRTGRIAWRIEVPLPAKSGVTVAGDVLFFGEGNGKFHAVDAARGTILFTFDPATSRIPNVGGAAAAPVAYVANGREFIVYAFGGNVPDRNNFDFVDPNSGKLGDAIIAFALPRQGEDDQGEDEDH